MNWFVQEVFAGKIDLSFIPFSFKAWFIAVDTCRQSNILVCIKSDISSLSAFT